MTVETPFEQWVLCHSSISESGIAALRCHERRVDEREMIVAIILNPNTRRYRENTLNQSKGNAGREISGISGE